MHAFTQYTNLYTLTTQTYICNTHAHTVTHIEVHSVSKHIQSDIHTPSCTCKPARTTRSFPYTFTLSLPQTHINTHAYTYRSRGPTITHRRSHTHIQCCPTHTHSHTYPEAALRPSRPPGSAESTGSRGRLSQKVVFPICRALFLLQKIVTWARFPGRWQEEAKHTGP